MAGDNIVIELDSSDEEAGPAPKKVKISKPIPNAMVHIPRNISNVTITPVQKKNASNNNGKTKNVQKSFQKLDKIVSKKSYSPLTVCNVSGAQFKANFQKPIRILNSQIANNPKINLKPIMNPIGLMKKLNSSQVIINKISKPPQINVTKPQINVSKPTQINVTKIHPNITITKTNGNIKRSNPCISTNVSIKKKRKILNKPNSSSSTEVVTVELDDEQAESTAPQWYLRPEDLVADAKNTEESNNKEPETKRYVEITIEDSPVKQSNKKAAQENDFLSITIEDSPVKTAKEKCQKKPKENNTKQPMSKKQLQYPKDVENVIEIEVPPIEVTYEGIIESVNVTNKIEENREESEVSQPNHVSEQASHTTLPKKIDGIVEEQNSSKEAINETTLDSAEFHPAYQKFINLCFELENSDDMKKIVDKKIKAYYKQVPKIYTESEHFIDMVTSKVAAMKTAPDKMYLFIKDIVDELNLQRKIVKSQKTEQDKNKNESDKFLYGEDSEYDTKRQRQIRMLEKTLKKLHRAIQKLEEQEVDFDDEEDSVYLLTERYKERMVRVHAKLCQLTNTKMPSEPYIHLEARPGQPMGPIKKIEKWINKKVPMGKPLPFPDFHDILRCVRESNEEDKLGWNEAIIMEQARDLFTRCGKKLQRRRQENEWRLAFSRISVESDPAEKNDQLKKKLEENLLLAAKRENEIFNRFADRQNQLKLEAEEINEVEGSSDESEDDDVVADDTCLETKEKRKERLKRLIEEKSKKNERSVPEEIMKNKEENVVKSSPSIEDSAQNEQSNIGCVEITADKDIDDVAGSVETLSDDSILQSDVDELHLLKKLHSENETNSSDSSDNEFCTDVLSSESGHNSDNNSGDIISIENSSYSESEITEKQEKDEGNNPKQCLKANAANQPSNELSVENVLDETIMNLSDDDNIASVDSDITCVNFNDVTVIDMDAIELDTDDINETVQEITAVRNESKKQTNEILEDMYSKQSENKDCDSTDPKNESQKQNNEVLEDTYLKQSENKDCDSENQRTAIKSVPEQESILSGSSNQDKSQDILQSACNENEFKTIDELKKNEIFNVPQIGNVDDNKQKKDDHVQTINNENESKTIEKLKKNEILDVLQKEQVDDYEKKNSVQLTNKANEFEQLKKNEIIDVVQKGNVENNKHQKDEQPTNCSKSEKVLTQVNNINMFDDILLTATDNDDPDDNLDHIENIMTLEEDSADVMNYLDKNVESANSVLELCKTTGDQKIHRDLSVSAMNDNNSLEISTNIESQECTSTNPKVIAENFDSIKQDTAGNVESLGLPASIPADLVDNVESNLPQIAGKEERLGSTGNITGLIEENVDKNLQETGVNESLQSSVDFGLVETNFESFIEKTADNKEGIECTSNGNEVIVKNFDSNIHSCTNDDTRKFDKSTVDISI